MATRKLTLVLDLDSGSFSTRVVDATGKLRTLDVAVGRTTTALNRADKAGQGFGSTMRQIHHSLSFVHVVMAAVTASVGGLTLGLVKVNAEAQRSITLLEGLSKGATQAARRVEAAADFKFIKEMSKNAPFSIAALTDSFVKLKSVGIDPTKGAMEALTNGLAQFGGTDDQFHRASIAIQQMMGKGVISMEELRQQLGEAFPTAIKVMARAAGMSIKDFVKKVSEGKVEAEALLGTNGKFYDEMMRESAGAAARMMQTFDGQVSVIKTKVRELAMVIGGFSPDGGFAAGGFMSELTRGAKDFSSWLSDPKTIQGAKEFGAALTGVLLNIKDTVAFLVEAAPAIKLFALSFLAFKALDLAKVAIAGIVNSKGLLIGANGQLVKSEVAARVATMQGALSAAKGRDATYLQAQAIAQKATATRVAARAEIAEITAKIAAMKLEQAAYQQNIALANQQRAAAAASAYQGQRNTMAGMGNLVVGAGADSAALKTAAAAKAATTAQRAQAASTAALAAVTGQLVIAENALTAATDRATIATGRITAAQRLMTVSALAARGAIGLLNGVMAMLGGPVIGSVLLGLGALAVVIDMNRKKNQALRQSVNHSEDALLSVNAALADAKIFYDQATGATVATAKAADEFKKAQDTTRGSINGVTEALVIQAEQMRKNQMIMIGMQLMEINKHKSAMGRIVAEQQANEERVLRGPMGDPGSRAANAGAAAVGIPTAADIARERRRRAPTREEQILANLGTAGTALGQAALRTREMDTRAIIDRNGLGVDLNAATSGSSGSDDKDKGTGRKRETPAQRLADEVMNLGATQASFDALLTTLDEGSEAAEKMRAKIKEIRDDGGVISPDMERDAIKAAQDAYNLGQAYDVVKGVFSEARTNSETAADALANLAMSTDSVDLATEQFARKQSLLRAEVIRLNPAIAENAAQITILDNAIAKSTADFKLAKVATSVRTMREEMEKLSRTSIDPNLSGLDEYAEKMREFARLDEQARSTGNTDLMEQNAANRTAYTQRALAELTFSLGEEARANEEALMSADDARRAQFDREVERINYLTDLRNRAAEMEMMTETERTNFAIKMNQLRTDSIAAANARLQRDTETPMAKMVREYGNTTEQMKRLQGEWAQDLMDRIKAGESNFGEFVIKVIEDYLWMIAQAKMAAIIGKGLDALMGIAGSALGGMFGGAGASVTATPGSGSLGGVPGFFGVPGNHSGGIVGKEATFFRNVSPAIFDGARRMHTGGIVGSNEIPTILERGEGVFTPEQMKAMGGAGGAGAVAIEFNLINESGQSLEASEGGRSFDGEKYIIDVIVSNMNKPGPLRSAMGNRK